MARFFGPAETARRIIESSLIPGKRGVSRREGGEGRLNLDCDVDWRFGDEKEAP